MDSTMHPMQASFRSLREVKSNRLTILSLAFVGLVFVWILRSILHVRFAYTGHLILY